MLEIDDTARKISRRLGADKSPSKSLVIVGVPENVNGVLYYGPEIQHRLTGALTAVNVRSCTSIDTCDSQAPGEVYYYLWNPQSCTLEPAQYPERLYGGRIDSLVPK
jgi:hypothetical protein